MPDPAPSLGQVLYPDPPAADPAPAPADPAPAPVEPKAADPAPVDPAAPKAPEGEGLLTKDPDKPAEGDPKPAEPAPTYTVESYKDLALPDGMTVDQPIFDKFKGLAAELGISPENAPKLLELQREFLVSQQDIMTKAITAQDQAWAQELNTIPELAGPNRAKAQEVVGRFITEFGTPEVRQVLSSYGLQNNPALARLFYSAAVALVEGDADPSGGVVAPRRANGKGQSLAQALYSESDPEGLGITN